MKHTGGMTAFITLAGITLIAMFPEIWILLLLVSAVGVLLLIGYQWLLSDSAKAPVYSLPSQSKPPLRLLHDIDNLTSFDPKKSHLFFEEVDTLKERAHQHPELLHKLERKERNACIALAVLKHHSTLERNLRRAIRRDDYGTILEDRSMEETLRFLESMGYDYDERKTAEDCVVVEQTLSTVRETVHAKGFDAEEAPSDGFEFELWVNDQLAKFGWQTDLTQPGPDQGLDVIASYNGTTVGIQCKRYKSNVGNKAVQEAYSAKRFFRLDRAIVVTTSAYTKAARELAEENGVGLYTTHDIPNLAELLGLA